MYKKSLNTKEIHKIKQIWFNKTLSYEDKACEIYNVISYDDLMDIIDWYNSMGVNIVEEFAYKELFDVAKIYTYLNTLGYFEEHKELEEKIDRITNSLYRTI